MEEATEKDKILKSLPASDIGKSFLNANNPHIIGFENFDLYKYTLRADGYIDYTRDGGNINAWRTPKGTDFINRGGYQGLERKALEEAKLVKNDRIWNRVNILAALLSLVVSVLAFINSNNENQKKNLDNTNLRSEMDSLKAKIHLRDIKPKNT